MQKGFSFAAAVSAIVTALLFGVLASLAIRPPGQATVAGDGDSQPVRRSLNWRVPSAFNSALPVIGELPREMMDHLAEATDGAVRLEYFEPGELVPALAITDSVRDGKVPAGFTWVGYDQGWLPASTLIAAVPFGMEPWEFMAWWYEAGGQTLAEALYHAHGVHPILCTLIGPETAGWFRNPVNRPEDLAGMKIRFAGLGGRVLQKLGASVTMIAGGEIFQALEKGAIDATEFSLPVVDTRLGFDRVAKINYFPGWHQPASTGHLLVNLDRWQALDSATRATIDLACQATVTRTLARAEAVQAPAILAYRDNGVTATRLSEPVLRALAEASEQVLDEEAAKDVDFARILESQRAFRAEYDTWKQLGYLPRDF